MNPVNSYAKLLSMLFLAAMALQPPAFAQRHELTVDLDTEDGNFIVTSMDEEVPKRIILFEQFLKEHPKLDNVPWVLEQLQELYLQTNQPEKSINAGERLLVADPEDLEAAMMNLKTAESMKNASLITAWKARIS